jgi:hypothetical protein
MHGEVKVRPNGLFFSVVSIIFETSVLDFIALDAQPSAGKLVDGRPAPTMTVERVRLAG